jgi:hypothetical protein
MTFLYSFLAVWAAWVFYLAVMSLSRHRKQMTLPAKIIGYPTLVVGVVLDVAINWTVGTLIFVSPPKEFLLTARLKRHIREGGWRGTMARWVCHNFLNVFDPGGSHC